MNEVFIYGGSTEIETAAHVLKTPIQVYFEGNPRIPACSWIVYGEEYVAESGTSIMLKWKNENHFEYVNKMRIKYFVLLYVYVQSKLTLA